MLRKSLLAESTSPSSGLQDKRSGTITVLNNFLLSLKILKKICAKFSSFELFCPVYKKVLSFCTFDAIQENRVPQRQKKGGSRIGLQSASHWCQKLKHSGPSPLAQANIDDWLIGPRPLSASPLVPSQSTFLV